MPNTDGIACVVISQEARYHQHRYAIVLYIFLLITIKLNQLAYAKMQGYRNNQHPYPSSLVPQESY